jgi:hypothetical protein
VTDWHRFPPTKIGSHWLASAEWFEDSRPVREGERCGTIREGRASTVEAAVKELEDMIA